VDKKSESLIFIEEQKSPLNIQLQDSAIQLRNVKETVASPKRASRNTVVPQDGK
jgi:hypothetical protein